MPEQRLDRHRRGDARGPEQPLRIHRQQRAEPGHQLRTVEEREALLRAQAQRLEAGLPQRDQRRRDVPVELDLAAPDERQREVRERRQVARGAHRALRRHDRMDAQPQEVEEALGHDRPSAGVPQGERVRPQQEHRPDDLAREWLAHARGVADEQVLLEPLGIGAIDRAVRERAHPGRDAVHDRALVDQ